MNFIKGILGISKSEDESGQGSLCKSVVGKTFTTFVGVAKMFLTTNGQAKLV